jgi:ribosomal protein L30/L7E
MNRSNVVEDTPSIRGMVDKVAHMLKIESAN